MCAKNHKISIEGFFTIFEKKKKKSLCSQWKKQKDLRLCSLQLLSIPENATTFLREIYSIRFTPVSY